MFENLAGRQRHSWVYDVVGVSAPVSYPLEGGPDERHIIDRGLPQFSS